MASLECLFFARCFFWSFATSVLVCNQLYWSMRCNKTVYADGLRVRFVRHPWKTIRICKLEISAEILVYQINKASSPPNYVASDYSRVIGKIFREREQRGVFDG